MGDKEEGDTGEARQRQPISAEEMRAAIDAGWKKLDDYIAERNRLMAKAVYLAIRKKFDLETKKTPRTLSDGGAS